MEKLVIAIPEDIGMSDAYLYHTVLWYGGV